MPRETFNNLEKSKQEIIIDAFLREFTIHRFDDASISSVLKNLGFAKGSFYQYFENKKDLFLFLIEHCSSTKMKYINHVEREKYTDFWEYWRALYTEGLVYDREHPLMSNFGYRFLDNMNSPTLKPHFVQLQKETVKVLQKMILPEITSGAFRQDLSPEFMAFYLMNNGRQLIDYMQLHYPEEFESRIENGEPLFAGENEKFLFDALEETIQVLSSALDNKDKLN